MNIKFRVLLFIFVLLVCMIVEGESFYGVFGNVGKWFIK